MGLLDDILKGLPANAVLREQITQLKLPKGGGGDGERDSQRRSSPS